MPMAHVAEDSRTRLDIFHTFEKVQYRMEYVLPQKAHSFKVQFQIFRKQADTVLQSVPLKMDTQILFMKDVFSYITFKF